MNIELIVLRLVHIVGGSLWVGSLVFTTFFLLPVLSSSGPAAAQVMIGLQRRKFFVLLPAVALLTILAGIRLLQITSRGFSREYFALASGKAYAVSAIMAVVALLIGLIVARPGAARMSQLSNMAVSDEMNRTRILEEIGALQRRVALSSTFAAVLVVLAAVGMAIARYL